MSHLSDTSSNNSRLNDLSFFHILDDEQRDILEKNLHIVNYKKKEIIFRQDTRPYDLIYIHSGLIKIFKQSKNDRNLILKVAKKGEYIGLMSVFGDKVHQYSAAALSECTLYHFDYTVFKSVLFENGKFALSFLKFISLDGLFLFDKLLGQSYKQLPGKVAHILLYFSEEIFQSQNFTLPFTRKELAEFSGTTKESFIRTLTEFKNDKIIEIDGASITIKSMDIIRTLSNLG